MRLNCVMITLVNVELNLKTISQFYNFPIAIQNTFCQIVNLAKAISNRIIISRRLKYSI